MPAADTPVESAFFTVSALLAKSDDVLAKQCGDITAATEKVRIELAATVSQAADKVDAGAGDQSHAIYEANTRCETKRVELLEEVRGSLRQSVERLAGHSEHFPAGSFEDSNCPFAPACGLAASLGALLDVADQKLSDEDKVDMSSVNALVGQAREYIRKAQGLINAFRCHSHVYEPCQVGSGRFHLSEEARQCVLGKKTIQVRLALSKQVDGAKKASLDKSFWTESDGGRNKFDEHVKQMKEKMDAFAKAAGGMGRGRGQGGSCGGRSQQDCSCQRGASAGPTATQSDEATAAQSPPHETPSHQKKKNPASPNRGKKK